jgi:hypothetical protein
VSKRVGVYITQTDGCDMYCYGINCVFFGYNIKINMHGTRIKINLSKYLLDTREMSIYTASGSQREISLLGDCETYDTSSLTTP